MSSFVICSGYENIFLVDTRNKDSKIEILIDGNSPGEGGIIISEAKMIYTCNQNVGGNTRKLSLVTRDLSEEFITKLRTKQVD